MSSKRRSYEAGHKRKYLVVIDDSEECDRAVYWAAKRAGRTKSQIVMLRVIEPGDRNQQWLGVADIMKAEAQEAANAALDKFAERTRNIAKITPDRVMNVPRIERRIVITTSVTFHLRSIPRFSWIMIECRNAVPVSQGSSDAFSTGSHIQ